MKQFALTFLFATVLLCVAGCCSEKNKEVYKEHHYETVDYNEKR